MNDGMITESNSSTSKRKLENIRHLRKADYLPKLNVQKQIDRLLNEKGDRAEILMLSSFPPRECGIATYSLDLQKALSKAFGDAFKLNIYPLESGHSTFHYEHPVQGILNTDYALDFLQAAYYINARTEIKLVMVQHEFGLFHANEASFLEFLEYLDKPVLVTFHTVLPEPSEELRNKVNQMAASVEGIVVMTRNSADILERDYGIAGNKITVISHGTHLVEYGSRRKLKRKYDLEGKTVLSTFGLLGPGKSIETTLDALPRIVDEHPDVVFCIIGKTHPSLVKQHGEAYRDFLEQKVETLQIQGHVRFIDEFVPLDRLLEYLQLTDIYLFTSKDPNQAVSGTFAYALSCGCPVISTPIPHTLEVLQDNGAGAIFDFEDSWQLALHVNDLLDHPETLAEMRLNGLHHAVSSSWENAAIGHAELFSKTLGGELPLKYKKPELSVKHIKKMTDHMGIIQFSKINAPDIESGYTLDDNARALIAICQHYKLTRDASDLKYIKIYFDFVFCCFRHDSTFLNYVDKEYRFTDQNDLVNLDDACGRAIWSLGYLLSMVRSLPDKYRAMEEKAKFVLEESMTAMDKSRSPRALAFMIKGLYYYNHYEERDCVNEKVRLYADRLVALYNKEADDTWLWFESYLTYGNAVLPEAVLMAYAMTLNPEYRKVARASFDFLLSRIMLDDSIRVISNKNWHKKGEPIQSEFLGGEQPIDVAYTILALQCFDTILPIPNFSRA